MYKLSLSFSGTLGYSPHPHALSRATPLLSLILMPLSQCSVHAGILYPLLTGSPSHNLLYSLLSFILYCSISLSLYYSSCLFSTFSTLSPISIHNVTYTQKSLLSLKLLPKTQVNAHGWSMLINAIRRCQDAMLQELRLTNHTHTSLRHFIKQLMCIPKLYLSITLLFSLIIQNGIKTPSYNHNSCQEKHSQKYSYKLLQLQLNFNLSSHIKHFS